MSDPDNGTSLALDEVVRRFADSEHALSEAHDRLAALARAEETQAASARGLSEASTAIARLVEAADRLIRESEETQRLAREVLQAGASLIDGTDLKEIQANVAHNGETLSKGFETLEKVIGDVHERDERIAALEAEVARRTAKLSGRAKKQLGV